MFSNQSSYSIQYAEITLGQELGTGGFGVVYHGTWRHNDIAVKKLLMNKMSADSTQEFQNEAQVMSQLRSPNIVQFYGYCMSPSYCIVMEYMPNGSLFSALRSDKSLDWSLRFNIALDMSKGLSFLHHENILHRDIKSLNVLLDDRYKAKLTDFGLSKVKLETKSNTMATKTKNDSVGTVAWMAPELFKRKGVFTQKSDIYSLGITFWELASGKIPFADAASQDLIPGWVQEGEREDIPKDCPKILAALIEQCWAAAGENRPDADAIVVQLKQAPELNNNNANNNSNNNQSNANTISQPHYQNNFNSNMPAKPVPAMTFSSSAGSSSGSNTNASLVNSAAKPTPALAPKPAIPVPSVSAADLKKFLTHVAFGEQPQAEEMLKKNKDLGLASGDITDCANRTFKNMTGFQYAVWALDWHMWTMLRQHLSPEATKEQLQGLKTGPWVSQHGTSVSWQGLVDAQQKAVDLYDKSDYTKGNEVWIKEVGAAQRTLPMHLINEYCHPTRKFHPCPDFTTGEGLPRSRKVEEYRDSKWVETDWSSATYNQGKLGETFGFVRGNYDKARAARGAVVVAVVGGGLANYDRLACHTLLSTRAQQRDQLLTEVLKDRVVAQLK